MALKNSAKRAWNNCSELFRDIVLTIFAMILGSGKFLKDIGSKMFFMTALFAPILGGTILGTVINDLIGIIFVLGISYTNYLTSYSSLKYLIVKNFKTLKVEDNEKSPKVEDNEKSPLLSCEHSNIQSPRHEESTRVEVKIIDSEVAILSNEPMVTNQEEQIEQESSIFQKVKNVIYTCVMHIIALTRMFYVVCDTYLGISNLYAQTVGIFGKTINPNDLNKLTNISGTYFAFSDGIMYCAYSYRLLLANAYRFRKSLTWDNIRRTTKWKLCLAGLFATLGILIKGVKDCFKISVSLSYVPLIKQLPEQTLTYLSYFGGVNSIFAKSISEGLEFGHLLYNPMPFWRGIKKSIRKTKVTYIKLIAFLLNSIAEAASGYQALEWLFDKTGLTEILDNNGYLNYVQVPCAIAVGLSVAAIEFSFSVRSLSENEKHTSDIESVRSVEIQESDDLGWQDNVEEGQQPGLYHFYSSVNTPNTKLEVEEISKPDSVTCMVIKK